MEVQCNKIYTQYCIITTYFKQMSFSGETSSGKSTLVNKILGIKLFKGRLNESTSPICKIRNSDQIRVITTNMTGEVEEKCFSDTCNLQQRENLSAFRRFLKKRTDLTHVSPDFRVDFQTVDIELPVPFLKVLKVFLSFKVR